MTIDSERNFPETWWSSKDGLELLARVSEIAEQNRFDPSVTALKAAKKLSSTEGEKTRRAVEIVLLRKQAVFLGDWSRQGLFTREALEQASRPEVSARHAIRFQGCAHVLEIGTGIGADTAALAKEAKQLTSIERNARLAEMATHNLRVQGIDNVRVIATDIKDFLATASIEEFDGLWGDPARRDSSGKRLFDTEAWSPPLSFLLTQPSRGPIGIKISPGTDLESSLAGFSREWIGFADECIEQTLWKAAQVSDGTVYIADRGLEWVPPTQSLSAHFVRPEDCVGMILVEPHAALIRSGHLADFYAQRGIALFDEHIAYGVAPDAIRDQLLRSFKVREVFPYNVARLNERLQALRWNSRSEVKKRGIKESAEEIRDKLRFQSTKSSSEFGTILLARVNQDHYCFLTQRLS